MKFLRIVIALGVAFISIPPAFAQTCIDPPTTASGKCAKQAGAYCDPASRRWLNGSRRSYDSCMAAAGSTPTYNDSYKNSNGSRKH
jgi:hypothetical protein